MQIPFSALVALPMAALIGFPAAHSQSYPAKPLRVIVPFSPGGGTDIVARILAPRLAERLGQQVIVDNRPGAGGNIGAEITVKSPADGYTVMVGSTSEIGIGPSLYSKLPYDVLRDLVAVTPLAATPMVLVVHPSMPVKTAKDLVALARARPGQINYGSAGAGSGAHMGAELFRYMTKIEIVHVPYKGVGPALADVIGGQVQVLFTTLPSATEFIKAGRLKALGVASLQRASSMPELVTMTESGVPGYEMDYWYGFFAPAATPKEIVARLYADTTDVLRQPDVVGQLGKQGVRPVIKTQEQFAAFVRADISKWAAVVKASGTKLD